MFAAFPIQFDYTIAIVVVVFGVIVLIYDIYETHRQRKK